MAAKRRPWVPDSAAEAFHGVLERFHLEQSPAADTFRASVLAMEKEMASLVAEFPDELMMLKLESPAPA